MVHDPLHRGPLRSQREVARDRLQAGLLLRRRERGGDDVRRGARLVSTCRSAWSWSPPTHTADRSTSTQPPLQAFGLVVESALLVTRVDVINARQFGTPVTLPVEIRARAQAAVS
jgi:hypothetical protein